MIDTHGNIRPGKPRKGREVLEYARVKADIIEMLDVEVPDREIAARLGLSRRGFFDLKRRILSEMIGGDIALNVAAREYMRLNRQMSKLIEYMDRCWDSGVAPEAPYVTAFTNLSRRIADLVGANAAIAFTIDNGEDAEVTRERHEHELNMAKQLNRFYELQDRLRGDLSIGSGMTREERDRELANLQAALPEGLAEDAFGDLPTGDGDDDIEDAIEVIEDDGYAAEDWHEGYVEVPKLNRDDKRRQEIEAAAGRGDPETPGRWVAGKFVSWWHDNGDAAPEDYSEWDTAGLDGEVWPE